jgi:anti-anti-sigma factor
MTTTPRDFWLAVHREPHRTRIVAGGRLVVGQGAEIALWLPYINAAAGRPIEIDLCGVTEIDARALGLLLELAYCADGGSTFRFVRASPRVRRLMRLTGLDTVLPITKRATGCGTRAAA